MELGDRGLTLIEVVVATAVVMLVVIAASNVLVAVDQATARAGGREAAESSVAAELEQLRSLPFAGGAADGTPTDVVSSVFPHAGIGGDTPAAAFAPEPRDGCPAGTFFTVETVAGGRMTIAATFVVGSATGWTAVAAARLAGYDAGRAVALPSAALLVRVSVAWQAGAHSGAVTREAIIADRPDGPCHIAAPAAPAAT